MIPKRLAVSKVAVGNESLILNCADSAPGNFLNADADYQTYEPPRQTARFCRLILPRCDLGQVVQRPHLTFVRWGERKQTSRHERC